MGNSEIIGRLENLKVDVANSPEFSQTATNRAQAIVDNVLSVFLKLNNRSMMGMGNPAQNVIRNFGLNNRQAIKSRLSILTSVDTLKNRINLNRELTPNVRTIAINKLDTIKRLR